MLAQSGREFEKLESVARDLKSCIFTYKHKAVRLNWDQAHLRWNCRQLASVLFADESKFNAQNCDGRTRVHRQRDQRSSENCVQKRNFGSGGGSVHVWVGITQFNETDLVILNGNVNARRYIDNVLRPVALPFLRQNYR